MTEWRPNSGRFGDSAALMARLLGPGERELTCDQCFEAIDRYVELELAGLDADAAIPGMGAHLQGCSACEEDRESLRALLLSDSRLGGAAG